MNNDGDEGRRQPLLGRLWSSGDDHEQGPAPSQQHQNGDGGVAGRPPWELVASSSSSEEEEAEEALEADALSRQQQAPGTPFAPLPLHQPLLPWALVQTPAAASALRREESSPSASEEGKQRRRRGWGRRLAKLLFWPPAIARWLPRYTRRQAVGDMLGGVTVAVMVIPQGMSYAVLAGLPPVQGLFAAMTGPLVYALLGTSRHLSIGPVALVSLGLPRVCEVIFPSIADLPDDQAAPLRVEAATAVALVSGLVLAALGLLRLGIVAHTIPPGVMVGFTNAAALAIGVSQLKELLGLKVPRYPYTWQTMGYVLSHLNEGQAASAAVGFGCILFLLGLKEAKARWVEPSPNARLKRAFRLLYPLSNLLLVVATALIASLLVHRGVDIAIVKDVPNGLPSPSVPKIAGRFWAIAGHSLSVVLVAFMEAYAIGRKYALQEGYPLHVNKELLALGAANSVASFFSSYPVSGSFSRSAVSYASGTATQLANAVAAGLVMLTVQFLAASFYYIPRATLGAIIEVALLNLLDPHGLQRECRRSRLDALVVLLTFAVTLALDTELGLLAGLGASLLSLYWMPRGGALLTRLLLRPTLKRRPRCDVLVLDFARFVALPPRIRRRLADYVAHERAARGAGPHMLVLLDGGRLGSDVPAESVPGAVREAVAACVAAGIRKEMVVPVGIHSPLLLGSDEQKTAQVGNGKDGGEENKAKGVGGVDGLLSPEQEEVARGVLARAHSLGLVCEYGERVALRVHGEG